MGTGRNFSDFATNRDLAELRTFLAVLFGTLGALLVSNMTMRNAFGIAALSILVLGGIDVARTLLGTSRFFIVPNVQLTVEAQSRPACRYMQSRSSLSGYDNGGPYTLDHFRLTKGRTDLREFLWTHWREHKRGVAEVRAGTVDRGTVKALYIVQPDAKGQWGFDMEFDRPMQPPCMTFHADSAVRVPIMKPDEDYPSQTIGLWPPDKIPQTRLVDSEVKDAKLYRLILVKENRPIGDQI